MLVYIVKKSYFHTFIALKLNMKNSSGGWALVIDWHLIRQVAADLRQQATQDADDNRALWENEMKSRSKLGLRVSSTFVVLALWDGP